MSEPLPKRRWSFSLRKLMLLVAGMALLFGLFVNLNWLYARHVVVHRMLVPLKGQRSAPWPLWLVGAPGYERLTIAVPASDLARMQQDAREGRLQVQRMFPEVEVEVVTKTP